MPSRAGHVERAQDGRTAHLLHGDVYDKLEFRIICSISDIEKYKFLL